MTTCHWRGRYDLDATQLQCVLHHCRHPHLEPGSHPPPPAANALLLSNRTDWDVPFHSSISYHCAPGQFFEDDSQVEPAAWSLAVVCREEGQYDTPVRLGKLWPNCTRTVLCPRPPEPPLNGSTSWTGELGFNTSVTFTCEDGSQFDTDNDGEGDQISVRSVMIWARGSARQCA